LTDGAQRRAPAGAPRPGGPPDGAQLGRRLRERDLTAAPATLNLLESTAPADRAQARALLGEVSPAALGSEAQGHIIGVTGPPGAGKSTLLSALVRHLREQGCSVAVLAVDPSSRRSGGALLGDRARIEFDPADDDIFIRSTAAGERLGGIAWGTRAAAQALAAAFDVVVIETVGVGQAETEVAEVADTVVVVVQPGSGDTLQFLKSGIMEIPDVLVVTKADLGQIALSTRRDLSAALRSLGVTRERDPVLSKVVAVSSLPPTTGIDELVQQLQQHWLELERDGATKLRTHRARVRRAGALTVFAAEHGERGLRALGGRRAAERWLAEQDPALDEVALTAALEGRMATMTETSSDRPGDQPR
jgi:LAO/AO transport system kinase